MFFLSYTSKAKTTKVYSTICDPTKRQRLEDGSAYDSRETTKP